MTYNNLDNRLPSKLALSAEVRRQLAELEQRVRDSRGPRKSPRPVPTGLSATEQG